MSSITTKAMLSVLSINMPGMNKLDKTATAKANMALQTSKTSGYYSKCKIDRKDLAEILSITSQARQYRRAVTRPWEGDLRLLPTTKIFDFNEIMSGHEMNFVNAVYDIQRRWPDIISRQANRLGPLFNPDEYPPQYEIPDVFEFNWSLIPVPDSNHIVLDLEKQVVDELKEKLEKSNQQKLNASMAELFKRLLDPVSKLADICGNDRKVFDSVVENLNSQIELLRALNITGDVRFFQLINDVEAKLTGYTVGQIRNDKRLKIELGKEADRIAAEIEQERAQNGAGKVLFAGGEAA